MPLFNLLIVSPCFYPDASPAELMVKSARLNNLKVHIYGVTLPFIPHGADAQVMRLWQLMSTEKMADYILVTDCRDVLFCTDEQEILYKFEAFGKDLVMSTETGCWPPSREFVEFFYGKTLYGYDYVNAGQYIAKWDFARDCLSFLVANYRGKDGLDNSQGWWMSAKMRGELDYALDSTCEIFQTMTGGGSEQIVVADKRPFNSLTNSYPCSIHYNGNSNTFNPHADLFRRLYQ